MHLGRLRRVLRPALGDLVHGINRTLLGQRRGLIDLRDCETRTRWKGPLGHKGRRPRDLRRWIEGCFNSRQLNSSLDYHSPIEWENKHYHHRDGDGLAT